MFDNYPVRWIIKHLNGNTFYIRSIDLLILVIGFLIFGGIQALGWFSDSTAHSQILIKLLEEGKFPVPPGYYTSVYLLYVIVYKLGFNGLGSDASIFGLISTFLLGSAFFVKYLITKQVLRVVSGKTNPSMLTITLISASLLFMAPVFYDLSNWFFYVGRVSPNVWHNSTTIFVMPFVLLLFMEALAYFKTDNTETKNILLITVWGFMCILIKPSFLFAFIPSFPLVTLLRFGAFSRKMAVASTISTLLFAGVLTEAYLIYFLKLYDVIYNGDGGGVVFAPFQFLSFYGNVGINMLVSFLFPLLYLVLRPRDIRERVEVQLAYVLMFFGLLVGMLFEESGGKTNHGNFLWQAIMTNYILFCVVAARAFISNSKQTLGTRKWNVLLALFGLHLISGFLYIFKYLITGSIG